MRSRRLDLLHTFKRREIQGVVERTLVHLNTVMELPHIQILPVGRDNHVQSHCCGQDFKVFHVDLTLVLIDVVESVDQIELRGPEVSVHEEFVDIVVSALHTQTLPLNRHLSKRRLCGEPLSNARIPDSNLLGAVRIKGFVYLSRLPSNRVVCAKVLIVG